MQSDPIGLEGGENTYLYADANPLAKYDAEGKNFGTIWGAESGAEADSVFGPVGAAVGAAVGAVVGTVVVYIGGKAIVNEISKEDNNNNKVALYRVVERAKYDDLMRTGMFRVPYGQLEAKQFWFTSADGDWYSKNMFGTPYAMVKIYVSKETLNYGTVMTLDFRDAVSFPTTSLPRLNAEMTRNGGIFIEKRY